MAWEGRRDWLVLFEGENEDFNERQSCKKPVPIEPWHYKTFRFSSKLWFLLVQITNNMENID